MGNKKNRQHVAVGENNGGRLLEATSETQEESLLPAIPSPQDMAQYQEIVPDFANRVLMMAEKQQEKNIEFRDTLSSRQYTLAVSAQRIVILFIVIGTVLCGYGFYLGFQWSPVGFFSIMMVFIVAVLKNRKK